MFFWYNETVIFFFTNTSFRIRCNNAENLHLEWHSKCVKHSQSIKEKPNVFFFLVLGVSFNFKHTTFTTHSLYQNLISNRGKCLVYIPYVQSFVQKIFSLSLCLSVCRISTTRENPISNISQYQILASFNWHFKVSNRLRIKLFMYNSIGW